MLQCPFCFSFLKKHIYDFHVSFHCDNEACMMLGEMTRFSENYEIDFPLTYEHLISRTFCVNEYYVQLDLKAETTIISKIDTILLLDPLHFNQVISFNLVDKNSIINKLKLIAVFS